MTTAVYIMQPRDGDVLEDIRQLGNDEVGHDGQEVYVLLNRQTIQSVVFVDASHEVWRNLRQKIEHELKQKIGHEEKSISKELKAVRDRVEEMLRSIRVGSADLHVFVHFGGQDEEQLKRFNEILAKAREADRDFWCWAISSGNHYPGQLFKGDKLNPPDGDEFKSMLESLPKGGRGNFEHFRALRILLENCEPDKPSPYDWSENLDYFSLPFSEDEREVLNADEDLQRELGFGGCFAWCLMRKLSKEKLRWVKQRIPNVGGLSCVKK